MGIACCKEEVIDFNQEVELNHFHLLRSVGKGAFGKVRVVQHKGTHSIYALKYINKAKCLQMKAVDNIIQERRLLEEVECPFVCNLRYAFQDDENFFMVIDLMLGGDLRFHLDRMGHMKEDMLMFWIAEIACALQHLHARQIVHRDIKPDNVLLDEKGHAHLTDFNIAVRYREEKPLTAVAGSMAYMAPEILSKKGYFASVDWWSLGVLAYELAFGKRPFRAKTNEALTQSILHDELNIPANANELISSECLSCITQFLTRDITKRLGCKDAGGIAKVKSHPGFASTDWEKLEKKEGVPIFVPDAKRANFDATHELEELLLEDNPLKVKPRKKKKENNEEKVDGADGNLGREMQVMEEKFLVYDYTKMAKSASPAQKILISVAALSNAPASIGGAFPISSSFHRDIMDGRDGDVNMAGGLLTTNGDEKISQRDLRGVSKVSIEG